MLLTEKDFENIILYNLCEDTALAYIKYLNNHDFFKKTNEIELNTDISYKAVNDARAGAARSASDPGIVDKNGNRCSLVTFIDEVIKTATNLQMKFDKKLLVKAATDYYNKRN